MRKTNLLAVSIIGALAASGCAGLHAMNTISVSRDVNVTASGSGCVIDAGIAPISVNNGNNGTLVFHVRPASSFKFTSNGIDFSKSHAPSGEFTVVNRSDTTWTIHDRNKTAGTFKYEVNVIPTAPGGQACNLDPTVLNDGSCPDSGC